MIPPHIRVREQDLPDAPGVYFMKDAEGTVLYVGKATSLKRRVQQHFLRPHSQLIEEMTQKVREIDYTQTGSALEALILEANLIKYYYPHYNTLEKDNKSFLYLVFTREVYPKPLLIRGKDLEPAAYLAVFGPYTSGRSLRAALDWLRKILPWSTCEPGQKRGCFSTHVGLCPGVCNGTITPQDYQRTIRKLIAFFEGKKERVIEELRREMRAAARAQHFELAAKLRNQVFALEHIQDIALLKREEEESPAAREGEVNILGRIEGYDISHAQGTSIVASMVVFEGGQPAKAEYRLFRIKTVEQSNDTASLQEAIRRRFGHAWPNPDLLLIDGGLGQVHAVEAVLRELGRAIPVIGMAKGAERKRTDLICSEGQERLCAAAEPHLRLLTQVRDEAHRFAITYHRKVRSRTMFGAKPSITRPRAAKSARPMGA